MKFEDLTVFDLNLIKNNAVHILIETKVSNRYEALIMVVLSCVNSKGFNLKNQPKDLLKVMLSSFNQNVGYGYGSKDDSRSADEVIKNIIDKLHELGIEFVKDESRKPTWSTPNDSWYTPYDTKKKSWVI